ncbi:MAG: class I SAM-dependent methyltransferase [Flavobacteriales bacterium]
MIKLAWNNRFDRSDYLYGDRPNVFFRKVLRHFTPGRILLPAEGEGRNAVFAASRGWEVDAFDFSEVARDKAMKLAGSRGVEINYCNADIYDVSLKIDYYDVVGVFFLHLPPDTRTTVHRKLIDSLKMDGILIMEVFSKRQIGKSSGGPDDIDLLYDVENLKRDFEMLHLVTCEERVIILNEGPGHKGKGSVIQLVGYKY